ncbi:hypothetical protein F4820DRAFT_421646 [Hypoxylon rubiginosum]|uniref:Uncharacterized protein n=1 Tax=Hypoxylon rubiginosum TaxID=110542 RepID=A0ACB9Z0M4_9PEZI|nr:hypothetical protein F4820DRAFT_421646 [Hypoxylon rubiginosum]
MFVLFFTTYVSFLVGEEAIREGARTPIACLSTRYGWSRHAMGIGRAVSNKTTSRAFAMRHSYVCSCSFISLVTYVPRCVGYIPRQTCVRHSGRRMEY